MTTVKLTLLGRDAHFQENVMCDRASWNGSFLTMSWGDGFSKDGMGVHPQSRVISSHQIVEFEVFVEK